VLLTGGVLLNPLSASSHREAPLISQDPLADNTDVYAFVSPERPDRVVLIANFIPLEFPSSGPNFWKFDDNVLYEIMVDNTGDAVEDLTYQFRFNTVVGNPNTFLYNTGQVTSIDDPDLNVRQFFTLTEVRGPRRTGTSTVIGQNLHVMPANVGAISMPNYVGDLGSGVHQLSTDGIRAFAGPRDDPFFVDLGATFDLLQLRTLNGKTGAAVDGLGNYNVHTIALEIPISRLTRTGATPGGASDPNATIGVWSTASRPATTTRTAGNTVSTGDFVQVSRLGMPLVNEAVIPLGLKDVFNSLKPTGDGAALNFVLDLEVRSCCRQSSASVAARPRNDLVTIFLTGIFGLNQPANVRPRRCCGSTRRSRRCRRIVSASWRRHRRVPERPPVDRRRREYRCVRWRARRRSRRASTTASMPSWATAWSPTTCRSFRRSRIGDAACGEQMKTARRSWILPPPRSRGGGLPDRAGRPRARNSALRHDGRRRNGPRGSRSHGQRDERAARRHAGRPGGGHYARRRALRQTRVKGNAGLAMRAEAALQHVLADRIISGAPHAGGRLPSQHRFAKRLARPNAASRRGPTMRGCLASWVTRTSSGEHDRAFAAFDQMLAHRPDAAGHGRASCARLQGDLAGALKLMQWRWMRRARATRNRSPGITRSSDICISRRAGSPRRGGSSSTQTSSSPVTRSPKTVSRALPTPKATPHAR
jgi:hypothetical protein